MAIEGSARFEMVDGYYYQENAHLIINPSCSEGNPGYKLNDMGSFIAKFVVQKVRVGTVVRLVQEAIEDRQLIYEEGDIENKILAFIEFLRDDLKVIQPATLPGVVRTFSPGVGPAATTHTLVCKIVWCSSR